MSANSTTALQQSMEAVREYLVTPVPHAPLVARPLTVLQSAAAWWGVFLLLQWSGVTRPRSVQRRKDRVEWDARMVSTIHAVVLVAGAIICFYDSANYSREQHVTGYTFWPDLGCRIFLGYLIYDVSCMLAFFKDIGEPEALAHHFLFIAVSIYVLHHSIMAYPFVWLAFGELSTPPLNLRWHLAVLGQKSSTAYLLNGLVLLLAFGVSRVYVNGAGLWHLWGLRDVWWAPDQPALTPGLFILFILGYALNLYWFTLIFKGAVRALSRAKPKQGKKA